MDKIEKSMNVIIPSTEMRAKPTENSQLETECLFGETIHIKEEYLDWVYCKLLTDNYFGWVKKNTIGKINKATHRVHVIRSFILKSNNEKSKSLNYLPMGSKLSVKKIKSGWAEVYLSDKDVFKVGFVPSSHITNLNTKIKDWVTKAEQCKEIPYKWGGRDTLGIDCSALLQLSYENHGIAIPRNTSEQINFFKNEIKNENKLKRGDLIFWKGHVGIMIDKVNCIHANAFHMKTLVEPLSIIKLRMKKKFKILKIFNPS